MAENPRFLALDVFRGMTVCFMIIVNTPGDWSAVYAPLLHAPWHGLTPTDLVFPSFLFAVGNAMAFVMHRMDRTDSSVFWGKTLKRFALIFLIGYLLAWFPFTKSIEVTRILGVLQRIALCYLVASVVVHFGSRMFAVAFSVAALLAYWWLLYALGDPNDPYSLVGYAGNGIDLAILGEKHMYHGEGVAFEPEGILSTLPAVVNVIAGFLAGDYIRRNGSSYETISKLLMAGVGLLFVALAWHMVFPINKKIWTSSFVLATVGIDLLLLPVLMYFIEVRRKQRWTYFFVVFGRNPLVIYALSGIFIKTFHMIPVGDSSLARWFYHGFLRSIATPVNASLLFALCFMMICWLVGYWMDRKKIYIRV